ncbi:MAG: hypothetical protein AAFV59_06775 [Pseudomonadota bacterium]
MIVESSGPKIIVLALVWVACVMAVCARCMRGGSVGLPVAYVIATTALYCGAVSYSVPDYSHLRYGGDLYLQSKEFTDRTVLLGLMTSTLGMVGFTVGVFLTGRTADQIKRLKRNPPMPPGRNIDVFVLALLCVGVLGFALAILNIKFPLSGAIILAARNAPIVALVLGVWNDFHRLGRVRYLRWGSIFVAVCATYVLFLGFASYAFILGAIVAGYWLVRLRPHWIKTGGLLTLGFGGFYLSVSVFVAWLSFRSNLRAVTWGGGNLSDRFAELMSMVTNISILSPVDFESLDLLNARFNQAIYVGKAVEFHAVHEGLKLHGESLWMSLFAWVPRFLWPDKPRLGGADLISEHTGLEFAEGISFGAGVIFEFFINFGYIGVFFGMLLVGMFINGIDKRAYNYISSGKFALFAAWFALGMIFIDPLLTSFFIVSGAVFSWLMMHSVALGLDLVSQPNRANRV